MSLSDCADAHAGLRICHLRFSRGEVQLFYMPQFVPSEFVPFSLIFPDFPSTSTLTPSPERVPSGAVVVVATVVVVVIVVGVVVVVVGGSVVIPSESKSKSDGVVVVGGVVTNIESKSKPAIGS